MKTRVNDLWRRQLYQENLISAPSVSAVASFLRLDAIFFRKNTFFCVDARHRKKRSGNDDERRWRRQRQNRWSVECRKTGLTGKLKNGSKNFFPRIRGLQLTSFKLSVKLQDLSTLTSKEPCHVAWNYVLYDPMGSIPGNIVANCWVLMPEEKWSSG